MVKNCILAWTDSFILNFSSSGTNAWNKKLQPNLSHSALNFFSRTNRRNSSFVTGFLSILNAVTRMRRGGFSPSLASWAPVPMWNSPPESSAIPVQLPRSAELESKRLKHKAKELTGRGERRHFTCRLLVPRSHASFPVSKLPTASSSSSSSNVSLQHQYTFVRLHGSWLTLWLRSVPSAAVHYSSQSSTTRTGQKRTPNDLALWCLLQHGRRHNPSTNPWPNTIITDAGSTG